MVSTSYGLVTISAKSKAKKEKTKSLHELICWLSDCLLWISDISRDAGWVNGAHRTAASALMCKSHNLRLNSCNINCIFLDFSQEVENAVVVFHVTLLTTINSAVQSVSSVSVVIIPPIAASQDFSTHSDSLVAVFWGLHVLAVCWLRI